MRFEFTETQTFLLAAFIFLMIAFFSILKSSFGQVFSHTSSTS
jgi:hypothetical protein